MKSKKLFKRLTALVLTAVMSFSCVSTALAETLSSTKTTEKQLHDWGYNFSNSGLPRAYDPIKDSPSETSSSTYSENQFQYAFNNDFPYWIDEDGKNTYCVQLGQKHVDSVTQTELDLSKDYSKYYTETQAKLIGYATIYGYKGTTHYGYKWDEELVATQCMIWCISARYFDSSKTTLGTNETKLLNCIKYYGTDSTRSVAHVKECFEKMKVDILTHTTRPSGTADKPQNLTSSNKYTLTYNTTSKKWECEIKSNAVMNNFDIALKIDGVTVTHSGNNLKFSCTDAGAKTLASKSSVELKKTRATHSKTIDNCSPVFLAVSKSETQAKISYFTQNDPVEAYVAFEMSTGSFTMDKKLNNTSTSITKSEYITYDKTVGAKLKYTWDKTYKWDESTSKWVEYKNAPTKNPTFSAGLRNIIRFKVKNSAGQYVVATQNATGKYTFSSWTTDSSKATEMTLSYDGNANVTIGSLNVYNLPTGTYTVEEVTGSDGYGTLAQFGITGTKNVTVKVTKDSTATATNTNTSNVGNVVLTKKLSENGTVKNIEDYEYSYIDDEGRTILLTWDKSYIVNADGSKTEYKNATTEKGTKFSAGLRNIIRFRIKNTNTGEYIALTSVGSTGRYQYSATKTTDSSTATEMTLGYGEGKDTEAPVGTLEIYGLPAGNYIIEECNSIYATLADFGFDRAVNVTVSVSSQKTSSKTATNTINKFATLFIEKNFELAEGSHFTDDLYDTVSFKVKNNDTGKYANVECRSEAGGVYFTGTNSTGVYSTFNATEEEASVLKLGTNSKTIQLIGLPVGTYTVYEEGSNGFVATSEELTVTMTSTGSQTVTFFNKEKSGNIHIQKITEGMLNIKGITFSVEGTSHSGDSIYRTATTDDDGNAYFKNVPIGDYVVKEDGQTVAEWYVTADSQDCTVIYNETTDLTFVNEEKSGYVEITKDTIGNKDIEGIEFRLHDTADNGREIWAKGVTNANGVAKLYETDENYAYKIDAKGNKIAKIPVGTYAVEEISGTVPKGYLVADVDDAKVEFNETTKINVHNVLTGGIEVNKITDSEDGNVTGAEFTVYNDVNKNGTYEKDIDTLVGTMSEPYTGHHEMSDLEEGMYLVKETKAPKNCVIDDNYYSVTIDVANEIEEVKNCDDGFINYMVAGIEVNKITDSEDGGPISGAEFTVYNDVNKNGTYEKDVDTLVGTMTESKTEIGHHEINNLPKGKYLVKETKAPANHKLDDKYYPVELTKAGKMYEVKNSDEGFTNYMLGNLVVYKYSKVNTVKLLVGAKFAVYKDNNSNGVYDTGDTFYAMMSETNGKHTLNNLERGHYLVKEIEAPKNYVLDENYYPVFVNKAGETYNIKNVENGFANDEISGTIKLQKFTDGMINLKDIEFYIVDGVADNGRPVYAKAITDENGEATFYETDKDGNYIVDENGEKDSLIPIGKYKIKENPKTIPEGYKLSTSTVDGEEVLFAEVSENTITLVGAFNDEYSTKVQVQKTTEGMKNLGGIEFRLHGIADNGREIWAKAVSDENGEGTFAETDKNYNYIKNKDKDFIKLAEELGFEIKGDFNEDYDYGIPAGTYTVTEVAETVHFAYEVAAPQEIKVVVDEENNEPVNVSIYNTERKGSIEIQKRTEGMINISGIRFNLTGKSDSGRDIYATGISDEKGLAELAIVDENGNYILNDNGEIDYNLPIGEYTVYEDDSTVPYGYLVAEPQKVTVAYKETTDVDFLNTPKTGKLELTKSDVSDGKLLPNCKVQTLDENMNVIFTGVTDEFGIVEFTLNAGKYYYQELEAPEGYVIDTTPYPFEIKENGEVVKAQMTNEKITGKIILTKSDVSNGKLLPNCKIAILDKDGNTVFTGVTDENGVIEFTLPYGKYFYQELEAPEGYVIDTTPYSFEIKENGEIVKANMTNEKEVETGLVTDTHAVPVAIIGALAFVGFIVLRKKSK